MVVSASGLFDIQIEVGSIDSVADFLSAGAERCHLVEESGAVVRHVEI